MNWKKIDEDIGEWIGDFFLLDAVNIAAVVVIIVATIFALIYSITHKEEVVDLTPSQTEQMYSINVVCKCPEKNPETFENCICRR